MRRVIVAILALVVLFIGCENYPLFINGGDYEPISQSGGSFSSSGGRTTITLPNGGSTNGGAFGTGGGSCIDVDVTFEVEFGSNSALGSGSRLTRSTGRSQALSRMIVSELELHWGWIGRIRWWTDFVIVVVVVVSSSKSKISATRPTRAARYGQIRWDARGNRGRRPWQRRSDIGVGSGGNRRRRSGDHDVVLLLFVDCVRLVL